MDKNVLKPMWTKLDEENLQMHLREAERLKRKKHHHKIMANNENSLDFKTSGPSKYRAYYK